MTSWHLSSSWERPTGMPNIANLEVMCGTQHMEVHLEFDSPFHGLVASKGMYGHEGCVYVPPRSGKNKFVFNIYYDKCGTKPDNHGKFYENTVVVQYDEELIEAWDEAKRLRCEWFNDYEKTATKTSPMVISDLEIVELNFHGDNVDCWMEIQEGKGPWAPPLTGIVPLGSTLTMVIAVKDPTGEFDMRVKDCDASDGQSGNLLSLSDTDGCIVRPKLIGKFAKLKMDDGRATVMTYAFLSAFKFPDMLNVHLRCTVEICRHGCPEHCSKLPPPPGSHIADVHGQFSDQEPIAVQSQVSQQKVKPNSIEETADGQSEGPEQVSRDKPDIHEEAQRVQKLHEEQQSSEEVRRPPPPQQHQGLPPPQHSQRHQHFQPPQQHQGPPMRYPSQQPPEMYSQHPPQMMHPPPPRYFGRGGPPQGPNGPPPPGMFRQPPRKLIPPGLMRQRPDIAPFQQHNHPNFRHSLPPMPSAIPPAFPSQMYRESTAPEQTIMEQHLRQQVQAERLQSMLMKPEHKTEEEISHEDTVSRKGEPTKDTNEEAENVEDSINEEEEEEEEEKEVPQKEEVTNQKQEQEHKQERAPVPVSNPRESLISQPQALKGDPIESIEDDSLSAEKAAASPLRTMFPKGPRSLRRRRSVSGSTDTIGVQGAFRVVSQADLNFALNATTTQSQPTVVLRGKMRSEDLVYGICLPRMGFGLIFFGLGVAVLVAILIASFLAYAHYSIHHLQMSQQKRSGVSGGPMASLPMAPPPQVLPLPIIIFKKMW
ncbi:RNA-binding protein 12B [Orchesella cincta]|uniref:RNA-binding protein 12B n=1 Tax=Orchesella cincta TaxID=48709 RepID=A0A1D2NE09_ORCCI|nr:RNA-binding protein 12B [Orchesella cincta]